MSDEYNGWTNYETWNVKLWLDNEEGSQNDMYDLAANQDDPYRLSTEIKHYVERLQEVLVEIQPSMFSDLLGAALSEVNWYEIAETYLEDIAD